MKNFPCILIWKKHHKIILTVLPGFEVRFGSDYLSSGDPELLELLLNCCIDPRAILGSAWQNPNQGRGQKVNILNRITIQVVERMAKSIYVNGKNNFMMKTLVHKPHQFSDNGFGVVRGRIVVTAH